MGGGGRPLGPQLSRRRFLKAAAAGSLLALDGFPARAQPDLGAKVTGTVATTTALPTSILGQPAANSPIDTVVLLMMENRSFDHYFGWLADDEQHSEVGRWRYGSGFAVDANPRAAYLDPSGRSVSTYHLTSRPGEANPYRGCDHPVPGHSAAEGRAQRDGGFLAPGSGNDAFALGYYQARDLPLYARLAREFTIFDRYHCSVLSNTHPNRLYFQAAQCGGDLNAPLPYETAGYDFASIWDRLLTAGVSCANYFVDLPDALYFGPRLASLCRPITQLFADAAAGTLPHVVNVSPGHVFEPVTDDHPLGDIRAGQRFVATVVRALTQSPQWERSVLLITYDEWGGFFDHVPPPTLPDDHASADDRRNLGQAGFRVPTLMVSPYALPGYVDHRLYDHASLLRFIEWRFLGAPAEGPGGNGWWLTARDRHAANIGMSLQTTRHADLTLSTLGASVPFGSVPCDGKLSPYQPGDASSDDRDETLRFLDRMGFPTEPPAPVDELLDL